MRLLQNCMSEYADPTCIYDEGTFCYRIAVSPGVEHDSSEANKNTTVIVYGDGALKSEGLHPRWSERVCAALRHAIHARAKTRRWEMFLWSMTERSRLELPRCQDWPKLDVTERFYDADRRTLYLFGSHWSCGKAR